jgi:hypothetical protein
MYEASHTKDLIQVLEMHEVLNSWYKVGFDIFVQGRDVGSF